MHILSNTYIVKLQHLNLLNVLLGFSDLDPDLALDPDPDPDLNNFLDRSRIRIQIKTFRIRHTV